MASANNKQKGDLTSKKALLSVIFIANNNSSIALLLPSFLLQPIDKALIGQYSGVITEAAPNVLYQVRLAPYF